jgi:Pectate lyase superfamily protein/Right handed beta helix region
MGRTRLGITGGVLVGGMFVASMGVSAAAPVGAAAVFNVVDFGATGNGVTDDAPAFRDAIAAADAAAGSTVYVPAGTYLVDRTTQSGFGVIDLTDVSDVIISGDGPTSVVKQRPKNWNPVLEPSMFGCLRCTDVTFADLALDGSRFDPGAVGHEQVHAIEVASAQDVFIHDVTFVHAFGDGVQIRGEGNALTTNVDIRDSAFDTNGRSGISIQGGTRQLEFTGNHFTGAIDQDIDFEPTGSMQGRPAPTDVLIQNNTMVRAAGALPLSVTIGGQTVDNRAERVQFRDNEISDGSMRVYNANDVHVEGNTISSSVAIAAPVVRVEGRTSGITIRDNTLQGSTPGQAVVLGQALGTRLPEDVLVELNRIHQLAAGNGVEMDQVLGPAVVRNNEITGSGAGEGVRYRVSVDDGLLRGDATVSGNEIVNFDNAAIAIRAHGTGRFGVVTMCGNQVSQQAIGIDIDLSNPTYLAEANVCTNVWSPEVTARVRTNGVTHFRGAGSPEGVVAAPVGSDFIRTDEGNRVYVKQSGSGSTGWAATLASA